ncbi:MAG: Lrp/AsnC family transcriptional regulator [Chloroflexi bacterium]|nr:Lrp/AsnC family transcriptional regulator [Chloroflexota bacterium]
MSANVGLPHRRRPTGQCVPGAPVIKAFVLVVTHPGATRKVAQQIRALPHVLEVHEVMGPYDIVAVIETDTLQEIPGILADRIRTLDGIQSTTSLVAFPQ